MWSYIESLTSKEALVANYQFLTKSVTQTEMNCKVVDEFMFLGAGTQFFGGSLAYSYSF